MRQKISIFLPTLDGGGAERVMVTLANAFTKRGYKVDLVLATAQGPFLKDVSPSVRIVDLKAGRVIKALWPLVFYLRKERPVAMLSAISHANVIALLAKKISLSGTRLVVSERGFLSDTYSVSKGIVAKINYFFVRWLYPSADAICSVSVAASRDVATFVGLPIERVLNIYNPFNLSFIKSRSLELLEHHWLGEHQLPMILAAGRLNEAKNFDALIEAFAQLRKSIPAHLVILGEGELRKDLEAQVAKLGLNEFVSLHGFTTNPYSWMAKCDLFVLSSRSEGLPGVLIEAMACGAPVVSTDCLSGPSEILENGRWGKLVPVGDYNLLAQAMLETLNTRKADLPDVRKRASDFEEDKAVDAYLEILGLPNNFVSLEG